MEKASPEVRKALIKSVKNQLKENNPPEARQTYMRLLGEGISEKNVYIYVAQALTCELFAMMREKRTYSRENHAKLLAKLPNLI